MRRDRRRRRDRRIIASTAAAAFAIGKGERVERENNNG
jgi:hypothetical protein